MKTMALRLHPDQDLLKELEEICSRQKIGAGCILACVGSLTQAALRFANQPDTVQLTGHFEIVSLEGVLSDQGCHCHIAISDSTGKTVGAHLMEGCLIYTTAEIVLGILPEVKFLRTFDPGTGYPELDIVPVTSE